MRIAWLADDYQIQGGAEMTAREFAAAAPADVDVVRVPPVALELVRDCDAACVFNCVTYPGEETIQALAGKPVVRYWNDVAPHGSPALTRWLLDEATSAFCSPLHFERFPWRRGGEPREHLLIPPPVDLAPFREAAAASTERSGAVSAAAWMNPGKAAERVQEWERATGTPVTFYGPGPCAPPGSRLVDYDRMPETLARFETFVFLPTALEPFCRTAVEAWAAGCALVVNGLIGARHWIEREPDALERAAWDFWATVERAADGVVA